MKQEAKNESGAGGGEGRKRLQTDPSILKTCVRQRTQRLIGSASRTMLTCVDQRFVSYWEDGMVRDTYQLIFSDCCFFWSARFALQYKNIFFDLFWNVRLFLRLNKGFRSFNLFSSWITKSDFLLFANAMVSCNVSYWAQLVGVFFFLEGYRCWILSDGHLQTVLLDGIKRQMSKACIDRSDSLIFQH